MLFFKLGIIAVCLGGLVGLLLIKSRIIKASLMAGMSGIMLLLIGMLTKMAKYEFDLFSAVDTTDGANPKNLSHDVSTYLVTHYQNNAAYISGYHFLYWVLFAFLLAAPFFLTRQKRKSI